MGQNCSDTLTYIFIGVLFFWYLVGLVMGYRMRKNLMLMCGYDRNFRFDDWGIILLCAVGGPVGALLSTSDLEN